MGILQSFVSSSTFWEGPVAWACFSFALFALAFCILRFRPTRRRTLSELRGDQSGAAAAVDFVLTIPIVMVVVLLAVQFALIANAALVVHYAAYSSARSARTFAFDSYGTRVFFQTAFWGRNAYGYYRANKDEVDAKADLAGRMALISLSPAKRDVASRPDRSGSWSAVNSMTDRLADRSPRSGRTVFQRKTAYAFDPDNADVEVRLVYDALSLVQDLFSRSSQIWNQEEWPVEATVSYKYYLYLPVARFFGEEHNAGYYTRTIRATVKVF